MCTNLACHTYTNNYKGFKDTNNPNPVAQEAGTDIVAINHDSPDEELKDTNSKDESWVDSMLIKIEESLDSNPIHAQQNLESVQKEIYNNSGFQLICDDSFFRGFKEPELLLCYKAIKALLNAIKSGLKVPTNTDDGLAIEEIKIVKTVSKMYRPIEDRYGLEVNYMISAEEWPALLNSQINGQARKLQKHRHSQIEDKLDYIKEALFVNEIQVDEDFNINQLEKAIHILEQAVTLEQTLREASDYRGEHSALNGKSYEVLFLSEENINGYENKGKLYVGVKINESDPLNLLRHLVSQANQYGHGATQLQKYILGPSFNPEVFNNLNFSALNLLVTREKVQRLKEDIQSAMLNGQTEIDFDLTLERSCDFEHYCGYIGISVQQAYHFLMNLREALSGGELSSMDVRKIIIANSNKIFDVKHNSSSKVVQFKHSLSAKKIHERLWLTTENGKAHLKKKQEDLEEAFAHMP